MKIYENGIIREMTTEELIFFKELQENTIEQPKSQLDLMQEEQERQAQAIQDLIMLTLEGGE
jgi:hypothetical protein